MGLASPWVVSSLCLGHAHLDIEAAKRAGFAVPGAPERQRLMVVPCDRDTDEMAIANDTVGGIEVDPACAGQIDLQPRMCGAAAACGIALGHEDIAAHE